MKQTQHETKLKALEKEAADAMEVAAQKNEKGEKAKAGQDQVIDTNFFGFRNITPI